MSGGVVFYGDPHGEWRPLMRACAEERPDGVVILGDCDLSVPFRQQLQPLFEAGIRVRWIPGNHDADREVFHDFLWSDYPEGNIHGRWERVGSPTVAGLGGLYMERVWCPRLKMTEPIHASRRVCLRGLPSRDGWRSGLPRSMRAAIFPEDLRGSEKLWPDVLVTHETPTTHRHGFVGVDEAARLCRARRVVYGHHHESCNGTFSRGARVQGLAKAEVLRIRPEDFA